MGFYDGTRRTIQDIVEDVLKNLCFDTRCEHKAWRDCELCPNKGCKEHVAKCYDCGIYACAACQDQHTEECPMKPEDTAPLVAQMMAWRKS